MLGYSRCYVLNFAIWISICSMNVLLQVSQCEWPLSLSRVINFMLLHCLALIASIDDSAKPASVSRDKSTFNVGGVYLYNAALSIVV